MGTLPESWSHLTSVSHCCNTSIQLSLARQTLRRHAHDCLCHSGSTRLGPLIDQCTYTELCGCTAVGLPRCWRQQHHGHFAKLLEQLDTGKHHTTVIVYYAVPASISTGCLCCTKLLALHRPPVMSVNGSELAAVRDIGLGQQQA